MKRPNRYMILVVAAILGFQTATSGDPAAANRDAVSKSLTSLANRAQEYYRKPWKVGGGSGSFATLTLSGLTSEPFNSVGSFALSSPTATSVTLTGTGIETGNDGATPVEIEVIVYADSMTVTVNN